MQRNLNMQPRSRQGFERSEGGEEIFEWSECREILTCNHVLVKVLKEAKEVNLENSDEETEPSFLVDLLCSSSSLTKLTLSGMDEDRLAESFPPMILPSLKYLEIELGPKDLDGDETTFWRNLPCQKLETLSLGNFDPIALKSFESGKELKTFDFRKLQPEFLDLGGPWP